MLSDKEYILNLIQKNPYHYKSIPDTYKSDTDIIRKAISKEGSLFLFTPAQFRNNKEMLLIAVAHDYNINYPPCLSGADPALQDDKTLVMESIKQRPMSIAFASLRLRNDKTLATFALQKDLNTFQYLSPDLRNDEEIIRLGAILCTNVKYISKEKKNDKNFVLKLLEETNSTAICEELSTKLKKDPDIAMKAVRISGNVLHCFHESIKDNKEIVMQAVSHSAYALQYASDRLKGDRDVVLAAVCCSGQALRCAAIHNDKEIAEIAVNDAGGFAYEVLSDELKKDKSLIEAAVRATPNIASRVIHNVPNEILSDNAFIQQLDKYNSDTSLYVKERLKRIRHIEDKTER